MESKTTYIRRNKKTLLKEILNTIIEFITEGNKGDLSIIDGREIKRMNEKFLLWNKYRKGEITIEEFKKMNMKKPKLYRRYNAEGTEYIHWSHKPTKKIDFKENIEKEAI